MLYNLMMTTRPKVEESKTEISFRDITERMAALHEAKNHDYGNSFNTTLDKYGPVASLVRIEDKLNRLSTLLKDKASVPEESVKDTLIDLANYSVMTLLWLENNKDTTSKTQWYG